MIFRVQKQLLKLIAGVRMVEKEDLSYTPRNMESYLYFKLFLHRMVAIISPCCCSLERGRRNRLGLSQLILPNQTNMNVIKLNAFGATSPVFGYTHFSTTAIEQPLSVAEIYTSNSITAS